MCITYVMLITPVSSISLTCVKLEQYCTTLYGRNNDWLWSLRGGKASKASTVPVIVVIARGEHLGRLVLVEVEGVADVGCRRRGLGLLLCGRPAPETLQRQQRVGEAGRCRRCVARRVHLLQSSRVYVSGLAFVYGEGRWQGCAGSGTIKFESHSRFKFELRLWTFDF